MAKTHLTTWGAITLQGPHHVAKQSRTMRVSLSFMAASKSLLLQFASRQLRPPYMTSPMLREVPWVQDLRGEVVDASLLLAHFGGVCEEARGEEWSVEVCGRGGADGSCLEACRCEQCSGDSERRRREHNICRREGRRNGQGDFKCSGGWNELAAVADYNAEARLFFGKALGVPAQMQVSSRTAVGANRNERGLLTM
jgi:hypothetical protein